MLRYVGVVEKDDGPGYSIYFPDFPGCVSAADTFDELQEMAEEALSLHIHGMQEDDDPIPKPTLMDKIKVDKDVKKYVYAYMLVEHKPLKSKAVRVNITIDENLLGKIDNYVLSQGINRSHFLSDLARRELY